MVDLQGLFALLSVYGRLAVKATPAAALCVLGDWAMPFCSARLLKMIVDNATHALVAWWLCGVVFPQRSLIEHAISLLSGSLMDLDHFIAAGSWRLSDATSLPSRPFMHAVTTIVFITAVLAYFPSQRHNAVLVFVATMSHQIRDAVRRGLWFWPFGSTPPLHPLLYLALEILLPCIVVLCLQLPTVFQGPTARGGPQETPMPV